MLARLMQLDELCPDLGELCYVGRNACLQGINHKRARTLCDQTKIGFHTA